MQEQISAVILCGGQARRMNGVDKGLQRLQGKPLYQWVYQAIATQVDEVIISANRSLSQYAESGLPVISDHIEGFLGPLSGMFSGLQTAKHDWVLFVPCDTPFLPVNLVTRLLDKRRTNTEVVYVTDGEREHPTCCLLKRTLSADLNNYLQQGNRRVLQFFQQHNYETADFSAQKSCFANINSLEQLAFYHQRGNLK